MAARTKDQAVTPAEWHAALHAYYAPHTVPAEVVRVAEVMAEKCDPFTFGPDDVPELTPRVFEAARRVIHQAGLSVGLGRGLTATPRTKFTTDADVRRELDWFEKALSESQADNVVPLPVASTSKPESPADRRRRLYSPFRQQDPPETAPEIVADETNEPPERENTRDEVSEPLSTEWDSSQPLASVHEWSAAVIGSGVGKRALRVAWAMATVADTRAGTAYLTESTARDRFGIDTTALYGGRSDLREAGFIVESGRTKHGAKVWRLTTPSRNPRGSAGT